MKIEFISKNDARRQTLVTLREFVKSNKDKIDALLAKEAKGMAKLEKNERKSLQKDALPDMNLAAPPMDPGTPLAEAPAVNICMGCGGEDTEPLGNHMGLDHFMCRDCGEVGVTIKEQNEQAEQNQAQNALEAMAQQSLAPMVKKDPNDTSEDQRETQPKDETEKAYKAAWLSQKKAKEVKKADSSSSEMLRDNVKNMKRFQSSPESAAVGRSADAGLRGEQNPGSFAPGASQSHGSRAYKSEMTKGDMFMGAKPMGKSVASVRQAAGLMGGSTPKMPSVPGSPTMSVPGAVSTKNDAFNVGGMNETTKDAMENGVKKAEKDPSKKPFNTGEGHGGVPLKEVPNTEVAQEEARSGSEPPPLEGGKEVSAPGSGGQIKKTNMNKGEMCQSAPAPLRKVADIRSQAAAKHAAKTQAVAQDVKAINAVSQAVQKADAIPSAPAAPGASPKSAPALPAAKPSSAPATTPPKL